MAAPTQEQTDAGMKIAEQEMEYRVQLFNKMVSSCFDKCMDKRYKEGELNVGENSCIDRCASKYWQTEFSLFRGTVFRLYSFNPSISGLDSRILATGIVGQMLGNQGGLMQ